MGRRAMKIVIALGLMVGLAQASQDATYDVKVQFKSCKDVLIPDVVYHYLNAEVADSVDWYTPKFVATISIDGNPEYINRAIVAEPNEDPNHKFNFELTWNNEYVVTDEKTLHGINFQPIGVKFIHYAQKNSEKKYAISQMPMWVNFSLPSEDDLETSKDLWGYGGDSAFGQLHWAPLRNDTSQLGLCSYRTKITARDCGPNSQVVNGTCELCPEGTFGTGVRCLKCEEREVDGSGSNFNEDQTEAFNAFCNRYTNVKNGLEPWVIAVVGGSIALVAGIFIFCFVRRRRKMREEMKALEAKNKSWENEQDLESTMQANMNPMMRKVHTKARDYLPDMEAQKLHEQEVDELNKHKKKLEKELRRLKEEKQRREASTMSTTHESDRTKERKKKEFTGGSVDLA